MSHATKIVYSKTHAGNKNNYIHECMLQFGKINHLKKKSVTKKKQKQKMVWHLKIDYLQFYIIIYPALHYIINAPFPFC